MLGSISITELDLVFEEYIMQEDISAREPPKVNVLYGMWKRRKEKQRAAIEDKKKSKQPDLIDPPADDLRRQMFPLVAMQLIGSNKLWKYTGDAPDWMRTIARWAGDQYRSEHPDEKVHEITDAERQRYFDMALKLFDEERGQHETQDSGPAASGPDTAGES